MTTEEYQNQVQLVIRALAPLYGVDPEYAVEIARLESGFRPRVYGDGGLALGLWQWHYPSWQHVRKRMGLPTDDLRDDVFESTITALYAIGKLKLERWWSTSEIAKRNVEERRAAADSR